jgi:hypothetical protein
VCVLSCRVCDDVQQPLRRSTLRIHPIAEPLDHPSLNLSTTCIQVPIAGSLARRVRRHEAEQSDADDRDGVTGNPGPPPAHRPDSLVAGPVGLLPRGYRDRSWTASWPVTAIMGGAPCVCGTRTPVATIAGLLAENVTVEEVLDSYSTGCW